MQSPALRMPPAKCIGPSREWHAQDDKYGMKQFPLRSSPSQQRGRIVVVDGFKNSVAKSKSVQAPVIGKLVDLIEVFVERFQNSESSLVHRLIKTHIGSINEPLGVLRIKLRRKARDGRGLGIARRNVGIQIRISLEHLAQPRQIVIQVREVAGDEC